MKTVRTAVRLLRELSAKESELGVSELARRLDLDKATVHRLLTSLQADRLVEQNPVSKRYRLGFAILDLAASRLQSVRFLPSAVDEVHRLCEQIGESVGIHLLDHHEMICLAFAEAQQPVRVTFWIGERSPVHLTSTGIAALSTMEPEQWRPLVQASLKAYPNLPARNEEEMESILAASARKGFAVADESYERGVRAVAVPVFDAQGAFACTICIAAPSQRVTMRKLEQCVPDLRDAAQRVSRSMMARGNASIVQRLGAGSIVSSR